MNFTPLQLTVCLPSTHMGLFIASIPEFDFSLRQRINFDLWHLQISQTSELTTLDSKKVQPSHSLPVCKRTGLAFSALSTVQAKMCCLRLCGNLGTTQAPCVSSYNRLRLWVMLKEACSCQHTNKLTNKAKKVNDSFEVKVTGDKLQLVIEVTE